MFSAYLARALSVAQQRFSEAIRGSRSLQKKQLWQLWLSLSILLGVMLGVLSSLTTPGVTSAVLTSLVTPPAQKGLTPLGYVINGAVSSDQANISVANAEDVNGDGRPDLIVGSRDVNPQGRSQAGRAYVIFGKATTDRVELSNLGTQGFAIDGASSYDHAGCSVASAGDVNRDGIPDIIVGAIGADPQGRENAGRVYVVFGKRNDTGPIDLNNLGGGGFIIDGAVSGEGIGSSVASAGDVNRDGIPDIIIGAHTASPQVRETAGRVYVVFGKRSSDPIDLSNLGKGGFFIDGAAPGEEIGSSVASAGDVNGDGITDLILGSHFASVQGMDKSGRAYVVFGKQSNNPIDLNNLGIGGFVINGAAIGDLAGYSVASAGDVNGDGKADLFIGARGVDAQGKSDAGQAYVVFGQQSNNPINLGNLGIRGFVIRGAAFGDNAGYSVASITDMNGDGRVDLLVGASFADPENKNDAGRAYVIFSKPSNDPIDLNSLGSGGFVMNGVVRGDTAGDTVASAGDVNGDGIPDIIVCSSGAEPHGRSNAGRVYVIFGKRGNTDPINLSNLIDLKNNDTQGFFIDGATDFNQSGSSVSTAGDVNGDGILDLIVGTDFLDLDDTYDDTYDDRKRNEDAKRTYVVFGKRSNFYPIDLSNLGKQGYVIIGAASSFSSAGDMNRDGIPDMIVGAIGADPQSRENAGRVYVVFGKRSNTDPIDLNNLGSGGFIIDGAVSGEGIGSSVASAGDMNRDGIPDMIVGAIGADPQGRKKAERAYVVFGKRSNSSIDLNYLGKGGFVIDGAAAGDITGNSVAGVGDVNGDNIPDLLVGASGADPQGRKDAGRVYIVFGKATTTKVDLGNLGAGGFAIDGHADFDPSGSSVYVFGSSVASAGDVNGDSIPDFIIGAANRYANPNGRKSGRKYVGRAYVVFGKRGNTNPIDVSNLGTQGFTIDAIDGAVGDYVGSSVASAGDVNGDGMADLIVGAFGASPQSRKNAGRAYVVFGKKSNNPIDLSKLGNGGFMIDGASSGDNVGSSVASAGDMNGDGIPDLILGAQGAFPQGRRSAGRVYVVFGKRGNTNSIDLDNLGW